MALRTSSIAPFSDPPLRLVDHAFSFRRCSSSSRPSETSSSVRVYLDRSPKNVASRAAIRISAPTRAKRWPVEYRWPSARAQVFLSTSTPHDGSVHRAVGGLRMRCAHRRGGMTEGVAMSSISFSRLARAGREGPWANTTAAVCKKQQRCVKNYTGHQAAASLGQGECLVYARGTSSCARTCCRPKNPPGDHTGTVGSGSMTAR